MLPEKYVPKIRFFLFVVSVALLLAYFFGEGDERFAQAGLLLGCLILAVEKLGSMEAIEDSSKRQDWD